MATYARVADLSSWVPNLMVRVMVLKKWKKVCVRGVEGMDVIVVDEEGTKIQASVTKVKDVPMFDCLIQEGEWYMKNNFYYMKSDLLGVISHVGDLHTVRDENYEGMNKRICKIHFNIRDLQNREIQCAARGSLANEFNEMWWRNRNSVVVCELTDWKIFATKGWSHVVDGGHMSRFEFDPQFPEAQELKNKFLVTSQHSKMSSNYRFYGQGAMKTP